MADNPAVEAQREAHNAAARALRAYSDRTGLDIMKAGIAAEQAVEAAWPFIRAAIVEECAQAIEAIRNDTYPVRNGCDLGDVAAVVRALAGPVARIKIINRTSLGLDQ